MTELEKISLVNTVLISRIETAIDQIVNNQSSMAKNTLEESFKDIEKINRKLGMIQVVSIS